MAHPRTSGLALRAFVKFCTTNGLIVHGIYIDGSSEKTLVWGK